MWLNVLTALKPSQLQLIENLSTMVIQESSDLDYDKIEDEHDYSTAAHYVKTSRIDKLSKSKEPADQRLS